MIGDVKGNTVDVPSAEGEPEVAASSSHRCGVCDLGHDRPTRHLGHLVELVLLPLLIAVDPSAHSEGEVMQRLEWRDRDVQLLGSGARQHLRVGAVPLPIEAPAGGMRSLHGTMVA